MKGDGNIIGGDWAKYSGLKIGGYLNLTDLQVNDWYTSPFISCCSEGAKDAKLQLVRQLCVLQSFTSTKFDVCMGQGTP